MFFSVVIPLYNKEKLIERTLRSVFAQTFSDFEIVIVDDGSTDGSVAAVEALGDPRIRIIRQQNAGVSAARNRGIAEARGRYISLLDGDDLWKPDYLATVKSLIDKYPDCQVFATNYEFCDQDGRVKPTILNNIPFDSEDGILSNYFQVASTSNPPICSISITTTKDCFNSIGGFPVGVRLGEDIITWAKLACNYKIAYTLQPKAIYIFASQDHRVVPITQPNLIDIVGESFYLLNNSFNIPYLPNTAALWHKMRMVTFIQLRRNQDARKEFFKIKSYIKPTKKDWIWYILSFMPYTIVKFVVKNKAKLQK